MVSTTGVIQGIVSRLDHYFFCGGCAKRLGICRAVFYGWYLCQLLLYHPVEYARIPVDYWQPVTCLRWFSAPTPGLMSIAVIVLSISLVAATLGIKTRWSTFAVAVIGTFVIGVINSYGRYDFHWSPLIVTSWYLPFSRCGDAFALDAMQGRQTSSLSTGDYCWLIRLGQIVLVVFMFTAGCHKLFAGWLLRPEGVMRFFLRAKYFAQAQMKGSELSDVVLGVSDMPLLLAILGVSTVVLEIGCVLALNDKWKIVRVVFIGGLFTMQLILALVLQTLATFPWLAMYVFWPNWCRRIQFRI